MSTPIDPISPDDDNPADDLKTDVVHDVQREHTITNDAFDDDDSDGD